MRQLVTKYQPPGVVNKTGEIFVDEVTGQIKVGDGVSIAGTRKSTNVGTYATLNALTIANPIGVIGDIGYVGTVAPLTKYEFDGSAWLTTLGAGQFFKCSGAALATSNAVNTVLWSVTIPANTAGPNSKIEIQASFQYTPNTNSKSSAIHVGQSFGASTSIFSRSRTSATHFGDTPLLILANRGVQNSQVLATAANVTFSSPTAGVNNTYSFDFTQAINVYFTGFCAVGSDFSRLDYASVQVVS